MKCPYCAYPESKVVDSRPADEGASIRRRRECLSCGKRFTTYETVESLPMVVVKKDGSRQSFDRRKVLGGMIRACEKRPVPLAEPMPLSTAARPAPSRASIMTPTTRWSTMTRITRSDQMPCGRAGGGHPRLRGTLS